MRTFILISLVVLTSCGGGGGSGSNFSGTFAGTLFLTRNTCGFADDSFNVEWIANQDGNSVALQSTGGANYIGSKGETRSTVTRTYSLQCTRNGNLTNNFAQVVETIELYPNGSDFDVIFYTNYGQCSGGNSVPACETIHMGLVEKQ